MAMTMHTFGDAAAPAVVLLHPACVRWDYFKRVIPLLERDYYVIAPAFPGYDESGSDFTGVEQVAAELEKTLLARGEKVACLYGCSMGGAIAAKLLANDRLPVASAVMDGGIMPYTYPRIVTRLIAVRDFLMIGLGKVGGIKLLEMAFRDSNYSKDDLQYVHDVLRSMSAKTIWRTFESCNNYHLPERVESECRKIEYWYGEREKRERRNDLKALERHFPQAAIRTFPGLGHAELAMVEPERMIQMLKRCIDASVMEFIEAESSRG